MINQVEEQIKKEVEQNDLSDFARYLGLELDEMEDLYDDLVDYDDVSV